MDNNIRLKRLRYRAWHRGTREADLMIGGFLDAHGERWNEAQLVWFETFLEEQDVDIMAWAMGMQPCPAQWDGEMMAAMRRMDFVRLPHALSPSGERVPERSEGGRGAAAGAS